MNKSSAAAASGPEIPNQTPAAAAAATAAAGDATSRSGGSVGDRMGSGVS